MLIRGDFFIKPALRMFITRGEQIGAPFVEVRNIITWHTLRRLYDCRTNILITRLRLTSLVDHHPNLCKEISAAPYSVKLGISFDPSIAKVINKPIGMQLGGNQKPTITAAPIAWHFVACI